MCLKAVSSLPEISTEAKVANRFLNRSLRYAESMVAPLALKSPLERLQAQFAHNTGVDFDHLESVVLDLSSCFDFVDGSAILSRQDLPPSLQLSNAFVYSVSQDGRVYGRRTARLLGWKDPALDQLIRSLRFWEKAQEPTSVFVCFQSSAYVFPIGKLQTAAAKSLQVLHVKCSKGNCLAGSDRCLGVPQGHPLSQLACDWYHTNHDKQLIDKVKPIAFCRVVDDLLLVVRRGDVDVSELCRSIERIYRTPVNKEKIQVTRLSEGTKWLGCRWYFGADGIEVFRKGERTTCFGLGKSRRLSG